MCRKYEPGPFDSQFANERGMPVYSITQANFADVFPQLQLSEGVLTDISNAVSAGKRVVVHRATQTHFGWTGAGYIIQDPTTGEAAYLISGGANGNEIVECEKVKEPKTAKIRDFVLTAILFAILAVILIETLPALIPVAASSTAAALALLARAGPTIAQLMAGLGITTLSLNSAAAAQNKYEYPVGAKLCGGTNCPLPDLYRGYTQSMLNAGRSEGPNMDYFRTSPVSDGPVEVDITGVSFVDPAQFGNKDGISTFTQQAQNVGGLISWWKRPEQDPAGILPGLCVVVGSNGHYAWQPQTRMTLNAYIGLLGATNGQFVRN